MKDWVARGIGTLLERVEEEIARASVDQGEERVHDLRTSIRRVRESLRMFKAFFPGDEVSEVRKALRTLMHLAAEIRNRDIATELVTQSGVNALRLQQRLTRERNSYRAQLATALAQIRVTGGSSKWKQITAHVHAPKHKGDWKERGTAEENAARVLPGMEREYWKRGAKLLTKHLDFERLHRFRLKTKRYRYTLELFRDVDPEVETELKRLKPVQDLLGEINDCATALELVGGTGGRHPGVARFMHERAAKKIAKLNSVLERQESD